VGEMLELVSKIVAPCGTLRYTGGGIETHAGGRRSGAFRNIRGTLMKTRLLRFFLFGISAVGISGLPTRLAYASLLGIDFDTGTLYSVSTANAALTLIGSNGRNFGEIEFSPSGTLYGFTTGSTSTLYTINPSTAAATPIGPLGLSFVFEGGLAFS